MKAYAIILIIRGFNDAVNCFPDEGWVSIINDGLSAVSVHINPPNCKQLGEARTRVRGGIVCAKAFLLLQVITVCFPFLPISTTLADP